MIDVLFITALGEESRAVQAALRGMRRQNASARDVHQYLRGELPIRGTEDSYDVCILELLGMGRVKAATAATQAITLWKPRYVILVGIAGGFAKKGVALGDVLIAEQVLDYELQKLTPRQKKLRNEVHHVAPALLAAAQSRGSEILRTASLRRPKKGRSSQHVGVIASGDKVDAAGVTMREFGSHWDKLIGIEMEAGGVAQACWEQVAPQPFFMIRGVSDLADRSKDKHHGRRAWREYACRVAARYAVELLRTGPLPIDPYDARSLEGSWYLAIREFIGGSSGQSISTDRVELERLDDHVTGTITSTGLGRIRRWRVDGHQRDHFLSLSYETADRDAIGIGSYLFERMNNGIFRGYCTGRDCARDRFVTGPCLLYRNEAAKQRYESHLDEDCHEIGIESHCPDDVKRRSGSPPRKGPRPLPRS